MEAPIRSIMRNGACALNLILQLAAAGLVLATVCALAARHWWAFDLFSHFRLQYVIAAGSLCVAALAIRAYPTAAVLAVVALLHGWAIRDLWLGGTAVAAPGGLPLRVVSANVWSANPTPEEALAFVRASDADVLVLVDARQRRWRQVLSELGALYPYRAPQAWRAGATVVLFSRFPVVREEVVRPPRSGRPYLVAELAVRGQPLVVVGAHPSSPSARAPGDSRRRNHELDHIAALVRDTDRPVIVAGDFNATPWSPHFRDLVAAGGLRNASEGHGYIATWPTWFWPAQIPIDHVLLKGALAVTTVRRGPAVGSDHYPLIADLRLLDGDTPALGAAPRSAPWAGAGARDARAAGHPGASAAPDLEPPVAKDEDQRHAGDEAADVRPERDAGLRRIGPQPAQQLEHEPEGEQPAGRDGVHPQEAEGDQDVDAGVGEQQQIGAEHPGDRAARADHRDLRARIGQRLGERRRDAARQVEREEADVAAHVLDVVPEHP
jgi:endonuclease/exonuclease/phosphatase (EEP) superfamily protein YafD